jgi:hypothetical protein
VAPILEVMSHGSTLGVPPPGKGAGELERLRFVRNLSARSLLMFGPVMVALFVLFELSIWAFAVLGVACLLQLLSILRLTGRMRGLKGIE